MDELLYKFNEIESFHWWWEGRREILRRIIKKLQNKPKKILDIGCGTGETLFFLKKMLPDSNLYGIDTSPLAVRFSKEIIQGKIMKASAMSLPFSKNSFDLVLILDVLEHIKNDTKVLSEAKKVLKSKGRIIITCPATSLLWSRHDTRQGHQRRYSISNIQKLAADVGLEVEFINYFNFFLFLPIAAIRLLGKLNIFSFFVKYDDSINYSIAKVGPLNNLLTKLILFEVWLMFITRFPFGVSVVAVIKK